MFVDITGFGNAPPRTVGGRVFCVFYILCGIPLFFVTALGVGELLETWIDLARGFFYRKIFHRAAPLKGTRGAAIFNALTTFILGNVLFILIPAGIFYSLEDWTFFEAIFSAVMTTLTIGFIDFIPGKTSLQSTVAFEATSFDGFPHFLQWICLHRNFSEKGYRHNSLNPLNEVLLNYRLITS